MMQQEFEKLVGYEVSQEVYEAIEQLYMNSDLEKAEFAKRFKSSMKIFALPKTVKKDDVLTVSLGKTPNGCCLMTFRAEVIGKDKASSMLMVKKIPNSFEMRSDYNGEKTISRSSVIVVD